MVNAPEKIFYRHDIDLTYLTGAGLLYGAKEYTRSDIAERQITELRAERDEARVVEADALKRVSTWKSRAEAAESKIAGKDGALAATLKANEILRENARLRALPLKDEVERILEEAASEAEKTGRDLRNDDATRRGAAYAARLIREAESTLLPRLRTGEQEGWTPDLLDKLAEHTNLELSWGVHPDDDTEACWQVHRVNGGRNDREWTLIGVGNTPREALYAAIPAAPSEQGGDRG